MCDLKNQHEVHLTNAISAHNSGLWVRAWSVPQKCCSGKYLCLAWLSFPDTSHGCIDKQVGTPTLPTAIPLKSSSSIRATLVFDLFFKWNNRAFRTSESESADFSEVRVRKFRTLKTPFRTRTWKILTKYWQNIIQISECLFLSVSVHTFFWYTNSQL
jgi:hypothetical protein